MSHFTIDDTGELDISAILQGLDLDHTVIGSEIRVMAKDGLAPVRVIGGRETEVRLGPIHSAADVQVAVAIVEAVARKAHRGFHHEGGPELAVSRIETFQDPQFHARTAAAARLETAERMKTEVITLLGPIREVRMGPKVASTLAALDESLIARFRETQTKAPVFEDLREGARAMIWEEGEPFVFDVTMPYIRLDSGYRRTRDLISEVTGVVWLTETVGEYPASAYDRADLLATVDVSGFAGGIAPLPSASAPERRSDVDEMFGAVDTPRVRTGLVGFVLAAGIAVSAVGLLCTSLPGVGVLLLGWYLAEVEGERIESGFYPVQSRHTVQNLRSLASVAVSTGIVVLLVQGILISNGTYVEWWSRILSVIRSIGGGSP